MAKGKKDAKMRGDVDETVAIADGIMDQEKAPTQLRAWFPESFLWQPLVETDGNGRASVAVKVPDTLTTWRVLALGQSQEGAQGGSTTTFSSTLPAYVDLNLPSFLYAGDRFSLPIQILSQQAQAIVAPLTVNVRGGEGNGGGMVNLGAFSSQTKWMGIRTDHAGTLNVHAELSGIDAIEKSIPVQAVGRPVEDSRGGTLGAPRTLTLSADPRASDNTLTVLVFPGALSVVQQEMGIASARSSDIWTAAYAWRLSQLAEPLVAAGDVGKDTQRDMALRALQGLRKAARSPSLSSEIATLGALGDAPAGSSEAQIADLARQQLSALQAPDGLWPGASSGLDDILVSTAQAVWALGPEEQLHRLKAQGAFERYRDRLKNPYVAAWALVAQTAEPQRVDVLKELVKSAIQTAPDGSRFLPATGNRPDGSAVSVVEATALAVLVFADDEALRADLCSFLLSHYSSSTGFGDGLSGLLAVRALSLGLAGDIPATVSIRLLMDGAEVGKGALDPQHPHQAVRLEAPGQAGVHSLQIIADPPVPGLAFSLVQRSYLPWEQANPAGLDLSVKIPQNLSVGQAATVTVTVAGPATALTDLDIGLPVALTVDAPSLGGLSYRIRDGNLHIDDLALTGGSASFSFTVTPTLSGSFSSGPSQVNTRGSSFVRVPAVWQVR
jgi:hypothetical protein